MLRKNFNLTARKNLLRMIGLWVVLACAVGTSTAQDADSFPLSFSGDAAVVSKYIWRGQRLTNDWSLQPAMTLGVGNFSFNVWGNMDLTAVNEGDVLLLPENPSAPAGSSGLKGKFSEVDYTFSYAHSIEDISIDVGTIFYTFPERSGLLASTTEIYGGVSFDAVPLGPAFTLYIDVDETGDSGDTGIYFLLSAGHSLPFDHPVLTGLDISGSISFVNEGFGQFYYAAPESGAHDANITFSLPMVMGDNVSAGAFVSYSALLGGFRDFQFQDPRDLFLGTAGSPASFADTVWGGITLNLSF